VKEGRYGASVPRPREGTTKTYDITRCTTLTDGVFAIVITLLVLDLKLPDPPLPGSQVLDELVANVPDFIGWTVSFVVLARFWMIHHDVVAGIVRCRASTIVANFAFMGAISLVPFGASLVGAYEFDEPVPVVVFSMTLGLSGLLLAVFTRFAIQDRVVPPDPHDRGWHVSQHLLVLPALAALASLLAFVHPLWTMVIWSTEAVFAIGAVVAHARSKLRDDGPATEQDDETPAPGPAR
jgi:uncharacterized membrane protein